MDWKEEGYSSVLLQLQCVCEYLRDLVKSAGSDSVRLGWAEILNF